MATCACGTSLPGRQQKCEPCKAKNRTGTATKKARVTKTTKPRTPAKKKPTAASRPPTEKVVYPDGLRSRGRQLWKALGHDLETPGGQLALEACRCADRLNSIDSLLAGGDYWFDITEQLPGSGSYTVTISAPLAEARQQQLAFKTMLAELGATRVKGNPGYGGETGKPAGPTPAPTGATPLAAARERRRRREQKA